MTLATLIQKMNLHGSHHRQWGTELQDITNALCQLAVSTEEEFLDLGENLQEYYKRTKAISQLSSQVAERLAGTEMNQDIEGLRDLLVQIHHQTGKTASGANLLSTVLSRLDDIRGHLDYFDRTIKNLLALCNMIRIESARLGDKENSFSAVSDEVKKLAAHIALKSRDLTDRLDVLARLIGQHRLRITDFERKEQGQVQLILHNATKYLDAIMERHDSSAAMLSDVSHRWSRMSNSIGEVVMSLQFHDITRQRIEHVCAVLDELKEKICMPATAGNGSETSWGRILRGARRKLGGRSGVPAGMAVEPFELQIAQLKHAEADLFSALERIHRNLNDIAVAIAKISADTFKTAGMEGKEGKSFLAELEEGLVSVSEALSAYSAIHLEWTASIRQVTQTVRDMSTFINEIIRIGISMRIIALNACIHAAHIGDDGAALGVLAEAIHQISADTSHKISSMSDHLSFVLEETGKLSDREQLDHEVSGDTTQMAGRIQVMLSPLRQMDGEQKAQLARIDEDGQSLTSAMEDTLGRLNRHDHFKAGFDGIVLKMEALVQDFRSHMPAGYQDGGIKEFIIAKDRYTMEQERQVHESVIGSTSLPVNALPFIVVSPEDTPYEKSAEKATGGSQEDLGDNVELF